MKQRNQQSGRFNGFLDSGTSFTGDLHFEGTVRIDGVIEGSVSTPDVLIVGPSAVVRANVRAGTVQVHGRIEGDVSCTRRLELCAEGRIDGNIETPQLVIEDGATFDGKAQMTDPDQAVIEGPAEVLGAGEAAETTLSTVSDDALNPEASGSTESHPTLWQNLVRQLGSAGLASSSSAPSDAE